MHLRLIAVGDRQPGWVDTAFREYSKRLPRQWRFELKTIATSRRRKQAGPDAARTDEGARIAAALHDGERAVMLDERGTVLSSVELADTLSDWQADGRDIGFVIGGPDGFSADCLARADFRWSLSRLTLPHGLVRVVFVEQLYRASTLNSGHPYHRD